MQMPKSRLLSFMFQWFFRTEVFGAVLRITQHKNQNIDLAFTVEDIRELANDLNKIADYMEYLNRRCMFCGEEFDDLRFFEGFRLCPACLSSYMQEMTVQSTKRVVGAENA